MNFSWVLVVGSLMMVGLGLLHTSDLLSLFILTDEWLASAEIKKERKSPNLALTDLKMSFYVSETAP